MSPLPRVYLLRHGYSTWQAQYDLTNADAGIYDAPLSERGREQVRAVAADVLRLDVELVVTSPLTRAVSTALGVFDGTPPPPVLVDALLRERLGDSCDIGRSPADLARDFPALDFTHLPRRWWYEGPLDARGIPIEPWPQVEERVRQFAAWVRARPERSVLVVSHHDLLLNLGGSELANCELWPWTGELPAPRQ